MTPLVILKIYLIKSFISAYRIVCKSRDSSVNKRCLWQNMSQQMELKPFFSLNVSKVVSCHKMNESMLKRIFRNVYAPQLRFYTMFCRTVFTFSVPSIAYVLKTLRIIVLQRIFLHLGNWASITDRKSVV